MRRLSPLLCATACTSPASTPRWRATCASRLGTRASIFWRNQPSLSRKTRSNFRSKCSRGRMPRYLCWTIRVRLVNSHLHLYPHWFLYLCLCLPCFRSDNTSNSESATRRVSVHQSCTRHPHQRNSQRHSLCLIFMLQSIALNFSVPVYMNAHRRPHGSRDALSIRRDDEIQSSQYLPSPHHQGTASTPIPIHSPHCLVLLHLLPSSSE